MGWQRELCRKVEGGQVRQVYGSPEPDGRVMGQLEQLVLHGRHFLEGRDRYSP